MCNMMSTTSILDKSYLSLTNYISTHTTTYTGTEETKDSICVPYNVNISCMESKIVQYIYYASFYLKLPQFMYRSASGTTSKIDTPSKITLVVDFPSPSPYKISANVFTPGGNNSSKSPPLTPIRPSTPNASFIYSAMSSPFTTKINRLRGMSGNGASNIVSYFGSITFLGDQTSFSIVFSDRSIFSANLIKLDMENRKKCCTICW